jgi:REP element-mobilizing transposase RayT
VALVKTATGQLEKRTCRWQTELMSEPLYTLANCQPAYQLRWALALFAERPIPSSAEWLETLKTRTEADGVRLLEHHMLGNVQLFMISTRPDVSPPQIVKSVKGRLQNAIREHVPKAFRRNFRLTSLGAANRESIEAYVAGQLGHHRMADPRVDRMLEDFQFEFPEVDLSQTQRSAHGEYLYNLHVVLVHEERWHEVDRDRLRLTADMIFRSARAKHHQLPRVALLTDHIHLTLGVPYEMAPCDIALSYMNNIAFAHGMAAMFSMSYYVGTFGEYDMQAVRRSLS